MKFSDHQHMEKIFQCVQKKLGRTSIKASFSVESYKTNVLTWRMFMASSMKAAIHWASFLKEFGNLQEHKIREHRECVQHHLKNERTF